MAILTRRRFLATGAVASAGYPVLVEPRWLEVTHHRVPTSSRGTRILHLTDLHASWAVTMSQIGSAIDAGLSEGPDLICLTGDFITGTNDFDPRGCVTALRRLTGRAPAFAVLGNHDGGSWARERLGYSDHAVVERILEDAGVHLLHNRSTTVEVRGQKFTMTGLGDLWSGEISPDRAFEGAAGGGPRIVLSHNPDGKELVAKYPWDLMLCGHTHGGQIRVPLVGPRYAPVKDRRFIAGLGAWQGRWLYVSRGVGNLGSMHFRCRPEMTILDVGESA